MKPTIQFETRNPRAIASLDEKDARALFSDRDGGVIVMDLDADDISTLLIHYATERGRVRGVPFSVAMTEIARLATAALELEGEA